MSLFSLAHGSKLDFFIVTFFKLQLRQKKVKNRFSLSDVYFYILQSFGLQLRHKKGKKKTTDFRLAMLNDLPVIS